MKLEQTIYFRGKYRDVYYDTRGEYVYLDDYSIFPLSCIGLIAFLFSR